MLAKKPVSSCQPHRSTPPHAFPVRLDPMKSFLTILHLFPTPPDAAQQPWARTPNERTDDPASEQEECSQHGAKTINRWREEFLRDSAALMLRCEAPARAATTL